ncbi:MAG: transposase [Deltaproteobacteria bacterium]|nr:transposase [Deltaproteobacteria bacterium]
MIVDKAEDHLPLERQQRRMAREGWTVPTTTLEGWWASALDLLRGCTRRCSTRRSRRRCRRSTPRGCRCSTATTPGGCAAGTSGRPWAGARWPSCTPPTRPPG